MDDLVERLREQANRAANWYRMDDAATCTEAAAKITALEASLAEAKEHTLAAMEEATHFRQALAEAEGRVIAEVVAWLRRQADAIDRLADEADAIPHHGGGPTIRTMAKARREAATALETGEWKKHSPPPPTVV